MTGPRPFVIQLAKRMAAAAAHAIRREVEELSVNIEAVREDEEKACGNGSGIT